MDENPYQSPQGKGADVPTVRPWADPGVLASLVSVLFFGLGGAILVCCGFVALILLTDQPMPAQFERLAPILCPIGVGASLAMLWLGYLARRSSSARRSRGGVDILEEPIWPHRTSSKPPRWSIQQHIALTFAVEIVTFLALIAVSTWYWSVSWLLLLPATALACAMVRKLTQRIPARCPECGRGAFRVSVRPFTYFCGSCKHTIETRIRTIS